MDLDQEQLKLLDKKERKEIRRKQRQEALRQFYRLRKLQKIVFWAILFIIVFGGLYIVMALVGYALSAVPAIAKNNAL